jgi:hypothetical protein
MERKEDRSSCLHTKIETRIQDIISFAKGEEINDSEDGMDSCIGKRFTKRLCDARKTSLYQPKVSHQLLLPRSSSMTLNLRKRF